MVDRITPFLMFEGKAEEAMNFYASLIPDARIEILERFGPEGPGAEGTILHAELVLKDQRLRLFDSPVPHAFGFTPSFSCSSTAGTRRRSTASTPRSRKAAR